MIKIFKLLKNNDEIIVRQTFACAQLTVIIFNLKQAMFDFMDDEELLVLILHFVPVREINVYESCFI